MVNNYLNEKEEYRIIDKDLYAYTRETRAKRNISNKGCDLTSAVKSDIELSKQKIKEYRTKIEELNKNMIDSYKLLGELYSCGFCDKSVVKQERDALTGEVIKETLTHVERCRNKGVDDQC